MQISAYLHQECLALSLRAINNTIYIIKVQSMRHNIKKGKKKKNRKFVRKTKKMISKERESKENRAFVEDANMEKMVKDDVSARMRRKTLPFDE